MPHLEVFPVVTEALVSPKFNSTFRVFINILSSDSFGRAESPVYFSPRQHHGLYASIGLTLNEQFVDKI
ncbi:MAG: hypothetical protein U9N85_05290 [Bacteroidota bacterium]|nr:hypothetical protein [Bacteroidota bacterium]